MQWTGLATTRRWLIPEVVQTSAMDCGPAALKCLMEGFDAPVSYGRLREACQTDVDGTSIDTIEVVANQLGLQAEQVMVPVDHLFLSSAQVLPAIVVVRHSDSSTHFVVAWRRHGLWLQIMDPAVGRRWVRTPHFVDDVFRHSMSVPAVQWRQWASTNDLLLPLSQQLTDVGAPAPLAAKLVERALKDPLWFGVAALEASVRFIKSMIDAGGLKAGAESATLAVALFDKTHSQVDDIFQVIPEKFWSTIPGGVDSSGELQLMLRGAVLLRVIGKSAANAESGEPTEGESDTPSQPSPELLAALQEKPIHPLATIWALLKKDGLMGPWVLTGAMGIASAVLLIEILLFRGLFDITWALNLPLQRMGALLVLMALVALLMLIEIPIITESMRYGRHLEVRLRTALLQKLPHLSDRYFQSRPISDMADRSHSIHMARQVPGFGLHFIQVLCDLGFTLVGIGLIDRTSLPVALLIAVVAIGIPLLVQPLLNERDLRVRNHAGALHGFNLDALLGLVPIRTHGAQRAVRRQHEGILVEWSRAAVSLIGLALSVQAMQALVCLSLVGVLLMQHFMRTGVASGSDLLLVYWALKLPALGQALTALAQQYPAQRNVLLRLLEPLSAPTEDVALTEGDPIAPARQNLQQALRGTAINIENGKILASGHAILEGINLDIASGEHVAIVGSSGAGKSTLLGLLLGWHRLYEGHLRVDQHPLSAKAWETLRRETAWVDPGIQIWNLAFIDNLTYACDDANSQRVGEILDLARLRGVLQNLPDGLQTYLGEGGALLSGGEGQRVRLARALMQTDVRLVLLDEPFRGLDRAARGQLLAQAQHWWANTTLLCVTHDMAETLFFNRVLVVEAGQIVEDGVPSELALLPSRYRELLEAEKLVRDRLWLGDHWRRIQIGPLQ